MFCSHDKSWHLILLDVKKKKDHHQHFSVLQDERWLESGVLLWGVNWIKKIVKGDVEMKYDKGDNYETRSRRRADVFTLATREPSQDSYLITNKMYFNTSPCLDRWGLLQSCPPAKHTPWGQKAREQHI